LLKLDVQGFELHVLRGADKRLADVRLVQAEMSFVTLYDGQPDWRAVVDYLDSHGVKLINVEPTVAGCFKWTGISDADQG